MSAVFRSQCRRRRGAIHAPNRQPSVNDHFQCQQSSAIQLTASSKHINKWFLKPHFCWRAALVEVVVMMMMMLFLFNHMAAGQLLPPPKKLHRVIAGFYAYHPSYDTDKKAPIASTNKHSPTVVSPPLLYDQPQPQQKPRPSPPLKTPSPPPLPSPFPPKLATHQKAVHYHSFQAEQNHGGDYRHHHHHHDDHLDNDHHHHRHHHRHRRPPKHHGDHGYHHYQLSHASEYKKVKEEEEEEKEYYKKTTTSSKKGYKKKKKKKYHKSSRQKYRQKGSGGHFTTGGFTSGAHYHGADWPYISRVYEGYLVLARKMAEYYGQKYHYPPHLLYVSTTTHIRVWSQFGSA